MGIQTAGKTVATMATNTFSQKQTIRYSENIDKNQ